MQRAVRNLACAAALAVWAPLVGACSSDNPGGINVVPKPGDLLRPDWLSFSGHKEEFSLRPPGPEDLVGPEGQCAGLAPDPAADQTGEAPVQPVVSGGIALQMTECDVVRRAGTPDRVELGTNDRGERAAVLTVRGPRRASTVSRAVGCSRSSAVGPAQPVRQKRRRPEA